MVKRVVMALVLVVLVSGICSAYFKLELDQLQWLINSEISGDNISPTNVENIIDLRLNGEVIRNTISRDVYVFWFNVPGEFCSFCVTRGLPPQDTAYVALVPGNTNSMGINIAINGVVIEIYDNMTFAEVFDLIKAEMQRNCQAPVNDVWVYMALKMLSAYIW